MIHGAGKGKSRGAAPPRGRRPFAVLWRLTDFGFPFVEVFEFEVLPGCHMYPLPAHYDRTQYTSTRLLDIHASCAFGFVNAMDLEWSVYETTTYEAAIVWREQHVAICFPFRDKEGSLHSERAQQPKLMAREEAISFSRPRWGAFVHVGECLPDFAVVSEVPALAVVPRDVQ